MILNKVNRKEIKSLKPRFSKRRFFLLKSNQKGMALIMVLSTIVFVILLIQETVFETQIEYRSAVAELNSLRAYYSAKAGMEVSLLRVNTYVKLNQKYSEKLKPFQAYADLIWKLPFIWPPPKLEDMDSLSSKELLKLTEDSFMQTRFITNIEPENSRIDINDLASPIPSLRKWTFQVLYRLINLLQINDQKLTETLRTQDIPEILQNIKDWIDPDTHRGTNNSLSENHLYEEEAYPPNRSFFTVEELNQVAGMSDILYKAIEPFITVHGEKGLNINTAPLELLQALHDEFPKELAEEITMLTLNPAIPFLFQEDTFSEFLISKGMDRLEQDLFPKNPESQSEEEEEFISHIRFDAPYNFRIKSTGIAGTSQKTILATYFNIPDFKAHFNELMKKEKEREKKRIKAQYTNPPERREQEQGQEQEQRQEQRQGPDSSARTVDQNAGPTIIYWKESF